jgi:cyclic dehypoxanthinyl futalosine synthase
LAGESGLKSRLPQPWGVGGGQETAAPWPSFHSKRIIFFRIMALKNNLMAQLTSGDRLNRWEALALWDLDLLTLGRLANRARWRLHPEPAVTYVVDRNINYTNICVSGCRFCAFYRAPGAPGGFVLDEDSLLQKLTETRELGGSGILLQGGLNPGLDLGYYEDLVRFIRGQGLHVHGFSPPEIMFFSRQSGLGLSQVIERLRAAGLGSIPGGGAEILVDRVRQNLSPHKCSAGEWLEVMAAAHEQGLKTTATMMFGHLETPAERTEHLLRVRDLQDATGGFTAFIPWSFQPHCTDLGGEAAGSWEYLKTLAISRLVLDNVKNLQVSWVTQGGKIAQVALAFGANDFGSTMIEENVVAAAGVTFRLSEAEIRHLITTAGYMPQRRDHLYRLVEMGQGRGLRAGGPLPPPPHSLPQSLELGRNAGKLGQNPVLPKSNRVGRGVWGEGREPLIPGPPPANSPEHPGDGHAAGEFAHFLGHHFPGAVQGFVDGCQDEVLEHLHVVGGGHFRVDLQGHQFLAAVDHRFHHAAAGLGRDGALTQFRLEILHFLLQGLGLFHEAAQVLHSESSWLSLSGVSHRPPKTSSACFLRVAQSKGFCSFGAAFSGAGADLTSIRSWY